MSTPNDPLFGISTKNDTVWDRKERDDEAKEREEAERLHDQEPGRWGDHASPARMRRDIARDRDEDRTMGNG